MAPSSAQVMIRPRMKLSGETAAQYAGIISPTKPMTPATETKIAVENAQTMKTMLRVRVDAARQGFPRYFRRRETHRDCGGYQGA